MDAATEKAIQGELARVAGRQVAVPTVYVTLIRLEERGVKNTGPIDRGFMDSIYFRDPNGQLLELACYKFEPLEGYTYAEVLNCAHQLRVQQGEYAIEERHLADAIAQLSAQKAANLIVD